MLVARLGLPAAIGQLFGYTDERWDGKGIPGRAGGEGIPLATRIVQVARDATFQALLAGDSTAVDVIADRAGHAFDPQVADALVAGGVEMFRCEADRSLWENVLDAEPAPRILLAAGAIDNALAAIGDFADLASRYLVGHSATVSRLAGCTGYRPDYSWIDLPVFVDSRPEQQRGVVHRQPGLYFVGLLFLYAMSSGFLRGVSRDAAFVARHIARNDAPR